MRRPMRLHLTMTTLLLACFCLPAVAQTSQKFDPVADRERIRKVYQQQVEQQRQLSEGIAPIVKKQLEINHGEDPAKVQQMFDAWQRANDLKLHSNRAASETNAARSAAATPDERKRHDGELIGHLNSQRKGEKAGENIQPVLNRTLGKDKADAAKANSTKAGPAQGGPASGGAPGNGSLVLPNDADVAAVFANFDDLHDNLANSKAYNDAKAINEAWQQLQGAGNAAGEEMNEAMAHLFQRSYDGAGSVSGAAAQAALRLTQVMQKMADLNRRIEAHNRRLPQQPTVSSQAEYDAWWNSVAVPYNNNAQSLNTEADQLRSEMNSVGR